MHGLRRLKSGGDVVARSTDGVVYLDLDGCLFARRSETEFAFADGVIGRLGGTVVYVRDPIGEDQATFWFEDNLQS